jgi:asparagine synthase (glutamine-hydrolysing)
VCGILGWLDSSQQPAAEQLLQMAELLAHRGPDDRGTFEDSAAGLALGHLRLSIIDLSPAGRQPMVSADGRVALTFNGEIYNFQELRSQLAQAGHCFRSRTDSEVLLHGYAEWGEAVVAKLHGMFAFAIWDGNKRSLFLARDAMGIKPLYWWLRPGGGFFFASEIKAFLALSDFQPALNRSALRQYLELGFVHDEHETSLAGVYKLPAGHTLTVQAGDRRRPVPRAFFTPPPVEPFCGEEVEIDRRADRLYEVLDGVVRQHLVADVPVGLLLSGGLDSSVIAALAARQGRVRTISMGFADSQVDERSFARNVSRHIGSDHEEVLIRPAEIADDVEKTAWYFDDLFGDWGLVSTLLLYRRCRAAGVKVVLVGEGADELFGGYPSFDRAGKCAGWRQALRLYRWYSGRRWGRELWHFAHTLRDLGRQAGGDPFATVRLFETRRQLPHHYIMKVDKASMAASVEARVPFLDDRVAAEGFRTPGDLLLREGTNKFLLRHMAERHRLLPREIARRPKYGASIATAWMDEVPDFRQFARDVVLDPQGLTAELGLARAMRAYFDDGQAGYAFPHGISIFSIVAWRLLLLNLWAKYYLNPTRRQFGPAARMAMA